MSNMNTELFELLAKKQMELQNEGVKDYLKDAGKQIGWKLGTAATAGAIALGGTMGYIDSHNSIQKAHDKAHTELSKKQSDSKMGKAVDVKVDTKNYSITYIDAHGNQLVKKGGDISKLANNPGNFKVDKKAFGPKNWKKFQDMGAIGYFKGKNSVFAVFPDEQTGLLAIKNWWSDSARSDWSIKKAIGIYAPHIENDTTNYLNFIKSHGFKGTEKLGNLSSSQVDKICSAINKMEGKKLPSETFIPAGPKLAQNTQKASINEMAYPQGWNIEKFKSIKSFNERLEYCKRWLTPIASGTGRFAFKIDEDKCLKLAKNQKGIAQNRHEANVYWNECGIGALCPIFDIDDNFLWIEMGLAKKITAKQFEAKTHIPFEIFKELIEYKFDTRFVSKTASELAKKGLELINNDEVACDFFNDFWDMIANNDMVWNEFTRLSSFGIYKDKVVVVDYGFSTEIRYEYYSRHAR